MSTTQNIDVKIYDMAINAAQNLSNTEKTQISMLLEVFHSEADPDIAFRTLLLHIARQNFRRALKGDIRPLLSNLSEIFRSSKGEELRQRTEKYLILLKWVSEALGVIPRNVKGFDDLISRW